MPCLVALGAATMPAATPAAVPLPAPAVSSASAAATSASTKADARFLHTASGVPLPCCPELAGIKLPVAGAGGSSLPEHRTTLGGPSTLGAAGINTDNAS